jgi:hypothetical protein
MNPAVDHAVKAYTALDPAGWVSVVKLVPAWSGLLAVGLGIGLLLRGTGPLFRVVSMPLGAAMGFFLAPGVVERLGLGWPASTVAWSAAGTLALVGLLFPAGLAFLGAGVPGGYLGMQHVTPEEWLMGFAPGLFIAGTVGALLERMLAGVIASFLGAWLLVLGLLAALPMVGVGVQAALAQPWGMVAVAGLFGAAASYYQLVVRPPPEEEAKLKAAQAKTKQKEKEDRALEKKFEKMSWKKK